MKEWSRQLRAYKHLTKPLKVEEQSQRWLRAYKHLTKLLKMKERNRTTWALVSSIKSKTKIV